MVTIPKIGVPTIHSHMISSRFGNLVDWCRINQIRHYRVDAAPAVVRMSLYEVQKLVQSVNRDPESRTRFMASRETFAKEFELTNDERDALVHMNIHDLYDMGVHPLLLRPFTIIHGVSEPDYLKAIRERG